VTATKPARLILSAMSTPRYAVPDSLKDQCDQAKYARWLQRKAAAHFKRDKKRGMSCTISQYKQMIHLAVRESAGRCFYTGRLLKWSLISTWDNDTAESGRTTYKRTLALLPTIDHTLDEQGNLKFVICAWDVNDAKGDLTSDEFHQLCVNVLEHRKRNAGSE
jgi:hypothetical protein